MDWQFKIGLGLCLVFGFLQFTGVGRMPNWMTWPGISVGILFVIWGLLSNHHKMPIGPVLVIIAGCAIIAVGAAWYRTANLKIAEQQFPSKLILSVQHLEIADPKANLTMNLLFHNDGTKDFIIDHIFMVIAGNHILNILEDNDTISNNFNSKAKLEYKMPKGEIVAPAGYYGLGALKLGFPRVLKPTELYPLQVNVPFVVNKYFKEQKLINIKKIPIGLQIWITNYKGQKYDIFAYPVAELHIENDNEMKGLDYNSPTSFNFEIENSNMRPSRVKSLTVSPGSVITPDADSTDVLEIKIK